jgi:hypothetical protein
LWDEIRRLLAERADRLRNPHERFGLREILAGRIRHG